MISVPVLVDGETLHFPGEYQKIHLTSYRRGPDSPAPILHYAIPVHSDYDFLQTPSGEWYGCRKPPK